MKVYFLKGFTAGELSQQNLIKKVLTKSQSITVYIEYYQDSSLHSLTLGTTSMTLHNDNQISRPIQCMPFQ